MVAGICSTGTSLFPTVAQTPQDFVVFAIAVLFLPLRAVHIHHDHPNCCDTRLHSFIRCPPPQSSRQGCLEPPIAMTAPAGPPLVPAHENERGRTFLSCKRTPWSRQAHRRPMGRPVFYTNRRLRRLRIPTCRCRCLWEEWVISAEVRAGSGVDLVSEAHWEVQLVVGLD